MKAFRFRLERVLEWRARQVEIEEFKLQSLAQERDGLRMRAETLERDRAEAGHSVVTSTSLGVEELTALDRFQRWVAAERVRIAALVRDCETRTEEQRGRLTEARRRRELLTRLRMRRREEWQAEFDREQEALASELHLAKLAAVRPPRRTLSGDGPPHAVQAAVQPPSIESTWPCAYPASSEHR